MALVREAKCQQEVKTQAIITRGMMVMAMQMRKAIEIMKSVDIRLLVAMFGSSWILEMLPWGFWR